MATQPDYAPDDEPVSGAMSDEELVNHLDDHETRAIGYYDGEIAAQQEDALNRYYRRPYGDEQAGRSKVVDATVAITVDNGLAAILKPFVSQDDVVAYEPKSEEDEEQAKQATEYANYVFYNDNPGFIILHDWFKDALLQKVGVVKVYWEVSHAKPQRLDRIDPMMVQQIMQESPESIVDGPFGPDEDGLYSLDVMPDQDGKLCIENVPPEEYRISPFARPGRIPPYEAHKTQKARSELIEMGFDYDVVMGLSQIGANQATEDSRSQARYQDEQQNGLGRLSPPGDPSRELVPFNDEMVLVDYDGDGVSELRRVMRSGGVILYNEEAEFGCFARLCPVPMPHKIYGQSLADQVIDEQRIATVLWRQTLDNLYLANNPRMMIPLAAERSDGTTIDDLLDDSPGAAIRTGQDIITPFAIPFVADKSFPMLDYVSNQAESRTGISKQGQGMDPEAVDKSGQITATQAAIMEDGRNARAELIARIFAETGIKDLFKLILKNLVTHQPRSRVIRLRNEWVEMDPRSWNADMDLSIAVGLGMGNKAEQIAVADGIIQSIALAKQDPQASTLFTLENIYNAFKNKFSAAGIKNTDDYIKEPERDQEGNLAEPEAQPDPEMMKAQAELQLKQQQLQIDSQISAAKLKAQSDEANQKIQLAAMEAEAAANLARDKANFEAQQARDKFEFERSLAIEQQQFQEEQAQRDAARRDYETDSKVSKNREGGDLSK